MVKRLALDRESAGSNPAPGPSKFPFVWTGLYLIEFLDGKRRE